MTVKLLTEHHLEFLSLKGGCTGWSESTIVKMPHFWKSHVTAQLFFLLGGVGPVVTTSGCVSKLEDCFNKVPADYQFCGDCRMYASCSSAGLYVRRCPGISVFDAAQDKCVDHSNTCSI